MNGILSISIYFILFCYILFNVVKTFAQTRKMNHAILCFSINPFSAYYNAKCEQCFYKSACAFAQSTPRATLSAYI